MAKLTALCKWLRLHVRAVLAATVAFLLVFLFNRLPRQAAKPDSKAIRLQNKAAQEVAAARQVPTPKYPDEPLSDVKAELKKKGLLK